MVSVITAVPARGRKPYGIEGKTEGMSLQDNRIRLLAFAAAAAVCFLRFGPTAEALRNGIFLCCLFCLSVTDLTRRIIPDSYLILSATVWAVSLPFLTHSPAEVLGRVLAAAAFGGGILLISGILDRIPGRTGIGGGDVKLIFTAGLYLGAAAMVFALLIACVLGLLAWARQCGKESSDHTFPFGPPIAAGTGYMLLWGEPLVRWFLGTPRG